MNLVLEALRGRRPSRLVSIKDPYDDGNFRLSVVDDIAIETALNDEWYRHDRDKDIVRQIVRNLLDFQTGLLIETIESHVKRSRQAAFVISEGVCFHSTCSCAQALVLGRRGDKVR